MTESQNASQDGRRCEEGIGKSGHSEDAEASLEVGIYVDMDRRATTEVLGEMAE